MLTNVQVRNFQSLRDVHLPLEKYTVIVGRSSSGKSALTRALRLLFFGGRGTSYVSHGEKNAKVQASFADSLDNVHLSDLAIETTRGKDNQYEVFAPEIDSRNDPEVYTKLSGAVPEAVQRLMQVSELSFADQFDKPYLLDATGSEIARSLGELTEVTRIFAAVKEANRRKGAVSSTLSTRRSDLAAAQEAAEGFRDLPTQVRALTALEARWAAIREESYRAQRLEDAIARVEVSESALRQLGAPIPVPPSLVELEAAAEKLKRYEALLREWVGAQRAVADADRGLAELEMAVPKLREELHEVLKNAGECPTCGAEEAAWRLSVTA